MSHDSTVGRINFGTASQTAFNTSKLKKVRNHIIKKLAKEWAADDRRWTTQETVELNLVMFSRAILAAHGIIPTS